MLGAKNFGWNNNAVMLLPPERRYAYRTLPLREVSAENVRAARRYGSRYIDIMAKISDAEGRVPVFTPDRRFISQDRIHLTKAGAAYLGPIVFADPALQMLGAAPAARFSRGPGGGATSPPRP